MNFDRQSSESDCSPDSNAEPAASIEASATEASAERPAAPVEAAAAVEASSEAAPATASEPVAGHREAPKVSAAHPESEPSPKRQAASLIPFIPPQRSEKAAPDGGGLLRAAFEKRFQLGAAAAGLALIGVLAAASISYKSQQDQILVSQNRETENLADTVKALKARIATLETTRRDDLADVRKSVSDLKGGLNAARDAGSATTQLSARYDRVEREQDARIEKLGERVDHDAAARYADLTAKLEKLSERVDHDASARNADLSARIEKLEKKAAAVVASAAPTQNQTAAAAPLKPPAPTQPAQGVSKETTGSIAPRGPIRGWIVREAHNGFAVVEGPNGFRQVGPGDFLPGVGRVERIERRGRDWVVLTNQGYIDGAYGAAPGPMGGMNGMASPEF